MLIPTTDLLHILSLKAIGLWVIAYSVVSGKALEVLQVS